MELSDRDSALTGREIADALWLIHQIKGQAFFGSTIDVKATNLLDAPQENGEPLEPASQSDSQEPNSPSNSPSEPQAEVIPFSSSSVSGLSKIPDRDRKPISVPDTPALPRSLQLARALRPLAKQVAVGLPTVIDEAATVDEIAETGVWQPVLKPESDLWLDVALVFDSSTSMCLWQRFTTDLHRLLSRYGEFRDVRVWRLQHRNNQVCLVAKNGTVHRSRELLVGDRRRVVVVVSDCVDQAWSDGTMQKLIEPWVEKLPTVIFQVFPERLWSRTALVQSTLVELKTRQEAAPSHRLYPLPRSVWERERVAQHRELKSMRLPVVLVEPDELQAWAWLVAGDRRSRVLGMAWNPDLKKSANQPESPKSLTLKECTDAFLLSASFGARELARLLASAPVITLPVIRLIRRTMLPQASAVHVAEVLMSGLFRISGGTQATFDNAEEIVYEIASDEVRTRLRAGAQVIDSLLVVERVSRYVAQRLGTSVSNFRAMLQAPRSASEVNESEAEFLQAFATVTATILRGLGQEFEEIAASLAPLPEPVEEPSQQEWPDFPLETFEYEVAEFVNFPPLEPFEFIDAQLVEETSPEFPPPLQTEEFTIITLELQPEEEEAPQGLEAFNFTVATLIRSGTGWQIQRQQQQAYRYSEVLKPSNRSFWPGPGWIAQRFYRQDNDSSVALKMVAIPGGIFLMGSPSDESERSNSESPQHEVTIQPFFMGQYPITQAQWKMVAAMPQVERELKPAPSRYPSVFEDNYRPVERVSWHDAVEFCRRLSQHTGREYRLPTEAEWEYACRAGTTTPFHFGETISPELANYDARQAYADGPTGEYPEETTSAWRFSGDNAFGLADMHGNVLEWCQDQWHSSYEGAPKDGSAWIEGGDAGTRVLRGGSWHHYPWNCRSAYRYWNYADIGIDSFGFRVVCSAPRILS